MTDMDPIEDEVTGAGQTSGDDTSMTDDEKTADASDGTSGGDGDTSSPGGESVGADATV